MGSFLKDTNTNKIFIPKTKIQITIRPYKHGGNFNGIQEQVFGYLKETWAKAGFELKLRSYKHEDLVNEYTYNRNFQPPITDSTEEPSWRKLRTPYQQDGCYIDLDDTEAGQAYQMTFSPDAFAGKSAYVAIDKQRAHVLKADVVHEFGHALGFGHEHQRIDRDTFVVVQDENRYQQDVKKGRQIQADSNFIPFGWYDYKSVMHYPGIFKINNQPIGGVPENKLFTSELSFGDIMSARFLYNEARIKEELDKQQQTIDDKKEEQLQQKLQLPNQSIIGTPLSLLFPPPNPLNQQQINTQRDKQDSRLLNLANLTDSSLNGIITRTYLAVLDQDEQLKFLKLPIFELDIQLMTQSKSDYNRLQCSGTNQLSYR